MQRIFHARPSPAPGLYSLGPLGSREQNRPGCWDPPRAAPSSHSQPFPCGLSRVQGSLLKGQACQVPLLSMCSSPFVSCLTSLRRERLPRPSPLLLHHSLLPSALPFSLHRICTTWEARDKRQNPERTQPPPASGRNGGRNNPRKTGH